MKRTRKPLACRFGVHSIYTNTTGINFGTAGEPIYLMRSEQRCNFCDWRGRQQ